MSQMTQKARDLANVNWFLLMMSLLFSGFIGWQGNALTSKQWIYLMTVPGGKWSWTIAFGVPAILGMYCQLRSHGVNVSAALSAIGVFSAFVSVCYILAPLQDTSLKTGGWWPWIIASAAYLYAGAVNLRDRERNTSEYTGTGRTGP